MPRAAAKSGAVAKKPRAPKAGAHKLADPLPEGTVMRDLIKKEWRLGKAIGSGGFGLLYLASPLDGPMGDAAQYVMKVEPHANGPLFCELAFYQRVAKPATISSWMSSHKIKQLGVPKYIAAGSYEDSGTKYRFMVMERYGSDLQKIFEANGKIFARKSVLQLAIRLLDALQYIHENEYVHADIKASNLLMGHAKGTTEQVYLVDYGLAYRYTADKKHKEYKADPRRAHDGTIEFTSRDAHRGVFPSRRADIEILGYCLLQWLCGKLPWETNLNNKSWVAEQKFKYMDDIPSLMRACFPKGDIPSEIQTYLECAVDLDYEETPDYNHLRQVFKNAMKKQGISDNGKLDLAVVPSGGRKSVAPLSPKKQAAVSRKPAAGRKTPAAATAAASATPVKENNPPKKGRKRPSSSTEESEEVETEEETPPPSKVRARGCKAQSPASNGYDPKRVPTPAMARLMKSSQMVVGSPAKRPPGKSKGKKPKVPMLDVETQTSPGLKGLRRSRRK